MRGQHSDIDQSSPVEAYQLLKSIPTAAMVDVRSRAEWCFVGLPDLSGIERPLWLIEWQEFPSMAQNPIFVPQLRESMGDTVPERLFFICRSGKRSMAAAQTVAEALSADGVMAHCTNVAEGFEGDLDETGKRGRQTGWKACHLPWTQS